MTEPIKKRQGYWAGKHFSEEHLQKLRMRFSNLTEEERKMYLKKIITSGRRVSKLQKELYLFLKQIFKDAVLEYPIQTKKTWRFADIGIPSLKIAFEYDGYFQHGAHSKETNEKRDKELIDVGWVTFRINNQYLKILSKQLTLE